MPGERKYVAHPSQKRNRACLRCDRPFPSEGPHNRLCQPCREYLGEYPPEEVGCRVRLDALESETP
jgi:hypothetical protein